MTAGRPRKEGPRHPNGDLVQKVQPSDRVIERRRALGMDPNDPRCEYPLGILWARGVITAVDHRAGLRLAALHQAVFGRKTPKSHLLKMVHGMTGGPIDADDPERQKRIRELGDELGEAYRVLQALPTSRPLHVLENLAIYDRPLRFMDLERPRSPEGWKADQRDLEALQEATDALARHWRMGHYAPPRQANDNERLALAAGD